MGLWPKVTRAGARNSLCRCWQKYPVGDKERILTAISMVYHHPACFAQCSKRGRPPPLRCHCEKRSDVAIRPRARRRGAPKPPLCKGGPVLAAKQVPLGCTLGCAAKRSCGVSRRATEGLSSRADAPQGYLFRFAPLRGHPPLHTFYWKRVRYMCGRPKSSAPTSVYRASVLFFLCHSEGAARPWESVIF